MIKVSIIIPVFNGGKHILRLLRSTLNQSLKEIEVIVVDDNSNDSTNEVVNSIRTKDSRVRYYKNNKNMGAGKSRNYGLSKARGQYVFFADADDTLDLKSLKDAYYQIKKEDADICFLNFAILTGKKETSYYKLTQVFYNETTNRVYNERVKRNIFQFYNWVPWNRIYSRKYLINLGVQFQSLKSANDLCFCIVSVLKAENMTYVREKYSMYYYHFMSDTQISNQYRMKYENFLLAMKLVRESLCLEEINSIKKSYNSCILSNYFFYKRNAKDYDLQEREMLTIFVENFIVNEDDVVEFLNINDFKNYYILVECLKDDENPISKENEKYGLDVQLLKDLFQRFDMNTVCLWGIGKYGKYFLNNASKHGFKINNLVDRNFASFIKEYNGVEITGINQGLRKCHIVFYSNQKIGEDIVDSIKELDDRIKAFDLYAYFQLGLKLEECIIEVD